MIYLDHHATTPCDERVVAAMLPFFSTHFGNASSAHEMGRIADEAVEEARGRVADFLGVRSSEIIWTSGATESNNLAILGLARAQKDNARRRIVTSAIEHSAVLGPCRELQSHGYELVFLPHDKAGRVLCEEAANVIDERTLLVSLQAANHEIGTIQPVQEIATLARERGAFVHCDAAQAASTQRLDAGELGVDLLSLSAHKMYGPKGAGALWVRGGKRFGLASLHFGGAQEQSLRPGTLNVPAVVGMGAACALCREMPGETARLRTLRDSLEGQLQAAIPNIQINGNVRNRLPHNSSLTFPGIEADALLANLPDLALSTGSACNTGAIEPSPVLLAIHLSRDDARCTVRIGLGRATTIEEIDAAAQQIIAAAQRIAAFA